MKYYKQAEDFHFFNIVFYEVENNVMYVYCPNCGNVHEIKLNKKVNVKFVKESVMPCRCFSKVPKYLNSAYRYSNIVFKKYIGEFIKIDENKVAVYVYEHTASFDSLEYNCEKPFMRRPIYNEDLVTKIYISKGGKIEISSKLSNIYHPISGYILGKHTEFHNLKSWKSTLLKFNLINDSLKELEGSFISSLKNLMFAFNDCRDYRYDVLNDVSVALVCCLVKYPVLVKLWNSEYKKLVLNKVCCYMYKTSNFILDFKNAKNTIDYKKTTLPEILKIEPSKLDNVCNRDEVTINILSAAQKVDKSGLAVNEMNVTIFDNFYTESILTLLNNKKIYIDNNKLFKYLRNQIRKGANISTYYDYLTMRFEWSNIISDEILFPANLCQAHDKCVEQIKIAADLIKNKRYRRAVKKCKKLEYTDGVFKIKVVRSANELIKYSKILENCATRYVNKVIDKQSVIFLVYNNKSESDIYMVEYDNKHFDIYQNYGRHNAAPCDEEVVFLKKWLNHIKKQAA